jgi:F420-dependent oxidoreductase-like protein
LKTRATVQLTNVKPQGHLGGSLPGLPSGRLPRLLSGTRWGAALLAVLLTSLQAQTLCAADDIRFGVFTRMGESTWQDVAATWKTAEDLGFDSAWVNDHLAPSFGNEDGSQLEAWTTLAALATQTTSIRIGVLVTGNSFRNPALLAKMATTVDHISSGRLILGIGAGWFQREYDAYGFHFGTARERAERLEEALRVITELWNAKHPSFRGTYYTLERAPYAPANVQPPHPPIVIGGQGRKWIVPLVARYAHGWNVPIGISPEGIRERRQIITRECERVGRTPCPTDVSVMLVLVTINRIPLAGPIVRLGARMYVDKEQAHSLLAGSPSAIAKHIRSYIDAGANEVIVTVNPPFDRKLLKRFAEEVVPLVRGG